MIQIVQRPPVPQRRFRSETRPSRPCASEARKPFSLAFITSRNGAKHDKPREEATGSLGRHVARPRGKNGRQAFFFLLLYTVTKQVSIRRGVAGTKCLAIRHVLNPKPSREPQHLHQQTTSRDFLRRRAKSVLICKPKNLSRPSAPKMRAVRVRAFANAKRAWTM